MLDRLLNPLESAYDFCRRPPASVLHLNRAHQLAAGIRIVCQFLRNSGTMKHDETCAPLSPIATEGLLQLAELACEQFVDSLERTGAREVNHD